MALSFPESTPAETTSSGRSRIAWNESSPSSRAKHCTNASCSWDPHKAIGSMSGCPSENTRLVHAKRSRIQSPSGWHAVRLYSVVRFSAMSLADAMRLLENGIVPQTSFLREMRDSPFEVRNKTTPSPALDRLASPFDAGPSTQVEYCHVDREDASSFRMTFADTSI